MKASKLIIGGGCGLAFGASFVNTGLLLKTGTSVSHLTGDIAKMTINLARWSSLMLSDLGKVAMATICFLLGAMLGGAVIHHPTLDITRPYGRTITGIGLLLIAASCVVTRHPLFGIGLAAFGCGLQNSLATRYRGIVLRTTHVTGMFTDLGVTLGMRFRGYDIPLWKISIPFVLILSFFLGGLVATIVQFYGHDIIMLAGIGYVFAGFGWTTWKHFISTKLNSPKMGSSE
jgi:uncharacterized membrane protein YoaK (UPF0700 family)